MKNNKLILFDWGNIVEDGDSCKQSWYDLLADCGYPLADARRRISEYELSAISTIEKFEETYQKIKKDLNLDTSFSEFVKLYHLHEDNINYYEDVALYEHSLKDKCYIGILSNLCILDKNRIDKQLGLNNYDYVFLSFEIGLKKPNIEIFKHVQNNVPFKPEDILFIDDKETNIESAKKMGWNTLKITGKDLDIIKEVCEKFVVGD